jgi:UDP-glucose 4-epimerase
VHVVVTGAAGFIGAHSCRALLEHGHAVTAVDDLSHGRKDALPPEVRLHVLDVRSPGLAPLLQALRPDAVLHLAAQMDVRKSVTDPLHDASVNVLGTVGLLEAARLARVRRLVFASSGGAVYGEQDLFPAPETHPRRPASPYGVSKLCGEEYLMLATRLHGLSTLSLRYANVYGPGQDPHGEAGVVAIFLRRLRDGEPLLIHGDGLQTRDYVHVQDVARANVLALESDARGALNIGTGVETSVLALAQRLAPGMEFAHAPERRGEQRRSCTDPAEALRTLGWRPEIALASGLAATAAAFAAKGAK